MSFAVVSEHADEERRVIDLLREARGQIFTELRKVIIGQEEVIEQLLLALFTGGNCLITGAPGLAKTLLVKSVADLFHLQFKRIQFTPVLRAGDAEPDRDGRHVSVARSSARPVHVQCLCGLPARRRRSCGCHADNQWREGRTSAHVYGQRSGGVPLSHSKRPDR